MGRVMLVLVALLMVGLWVNSVVSDRPTRSQARAATPTVTRVSTPTPAPETTATAAATPVVSATPSGPETICETYVVQRGDTLNRIAARFSQEAGHNVTVAAIVAANGIPNPARIAVGQQFTIPVVVGTIGSDPEERAAPAPQAAVPTATPRPARTATPQPVAIPISAKKLLGAYESNELAADQAYKGKVLDVTGTVELIGSGLFGSKYVTLTDGSKYPMRSIQCTFSRKHVGQLLRLEKGQLVTVRGKLGGGGVFNIPMQNCRVIG